MNWPECLYYMIPAGIAITVVVLAFAFVFIQLCVNASNAAEDAAEAYEILDDFNAYVRIRLRDLSCNFQPAIALDILEKHFTKKKDEEALMLITTLRSLLQRKKGRKRTTTPTEGT